MLSVHCNCCLLKRLKLWLTEAVAGADAAQCPEAGKER